MRQTAVAAVLLALCACDDDTGGSPPDAGADLAQDLATDSPKVTPDHGPGPGKPFDRFCAGKRWDDTLTPATVGKLAGKHVGHLSGTGTTPFQPWTLETIKVVPKHPFWVKKIRVAFAEGKGTARIRLVSTFGRSVPGSYPDITKETHDLLQPREVEVKQPDPDKWIEIDVSDERLFLLPTQHYMIVYQHLTAEPFLALEDVPAGEISRSFLFLPTSIQTYSVNGPGGAAANYRLELSGEHFCSWDEPDRWFGADTTQPFASESSYRVAVVDLDGDDNEDVVINVSKKVDGVNEPGPLAFLGDGKGGFSKPPFDPFPDVRSTSMLVFGDIDNDGDRDAVAFSYIPADNDGDDFQVTGTKPDCNDADAKVYPGASETKNGYDDDCDGKADDGADVSDADGDGHSIAAGDCDDTRKTVFPGAPELPDGRDNDCDLAVDEDFGNRVLLNDGKGILTTLPGSGVEVLDPSTAAAFGDGNADGVLDIYWGNWLVHYPDDPAIPDRYFHGKGDGTFVDALAGSGLTPKMPYSVYGVGWLDYNNDGHQDIYVGNYHLYPNQLWENQGDGTFVDVAEKVGVAHDSIPAPASVAASGLTGGHTYGSDFGDVDNDGDIDIFIPNLAHPRVRPWSDPSVLALNQGPPTYTFVDKTTDQGLIYDEGDVNAAFADFDNDGDLDLVIATLYSNHYSKLYRNDGPAGFVDVTYESGTAVHDAVSAVWVDVDKDGDLDLMITGRASNSNHVHLFVNRLGSDNNWITFALQGKTATRDAVGARVTLTSGGVTQVRDVRGGGGHSNPQRPFTLHFGLAKNSTIDKLTVRWVGGTTETITGAQVNQRMRIVQGSGTAVTIKP